MKATSLEEVDWASATIANGYKYIDTETNSDYICMGDFQEL